MEERALSISLDLTSAIIAMIAVSGTVVGDVVSFWLSPRRDDQLRTRNRQREDYHRFTDVNRRTYARLSAAPHTLVSPPRYPDPSDASFAALESPEQRRDRKVELDRQHSLSDQMLEIFTEIQLIATKPVREAADAYLEATVAVMIAMQRGESQPGADDVVRREVKAARDAFVRAARAELNPPQPGATGVAQGVSQADSGDASA